MDKKNIASFEDLKKAIEESGKIYDEKLIEKAYLLANKAHEGQVRCSGAPYISHPLAVAIILVGLGMDTESVVASLLHDVVEDTSVEISLIEKEFGNEISVLVEGVTKLGQVPYISREEQQAENIRKMLLAMAMDIRVMIIKLADRLHNARTFEFLPEEKRRYKALETMEIYAPIADRLGIRTIKEELEDTSLRYLDPIAFAEIERRLNDTFEQEKFLENIIKKMNERIHEEHPRAHIEGRIKSRYGIYRKVYMNGRDFSDVYDIYAVRVIVDSVIECYNILGIIHDMFKPIPNRFKDYISTPKQNMYQSLHTSVFDITGTPFEIQIRTWDMHYTAEYGIAAHWKYKMGFGGKVHMEDRLAWVRQLLESQQDGDDAEEIVRSIKTDIAPEEVFVFTPKGDVMSLPMGATVLDYAYKIHSAVGNHMVGAKIDGKIVAIDTPVQTGMIIEVMTQGNKTPNRDWLSIARTGEARTKIRSWFKKEKREENIEEGREILLREFKHNSINATEEQLEMILQSEAKKQNLQTSDDFLAAIGYGGVALSRILPRLKDEYQRKYRNPEDEENKTPAVRIKKEKKVISGVVVEGVDNCLVKFAKCCSPLPGDDIVGFITRGYGVSIHKKDCPNAILAMENKDQTERWLKAYWSGNVADSFQSSIEIIGQKRDGLLADVSILFNSLRVDLHSFNAKELKDETLMFKITMAVNDIQQLDFVINQIKKIRGILTVERVSG